uniref:uncharacterized protein LOC108949545 n=1 Tax=Ciona intestinalis TaxID=7719 RepID=UPI00089DCBA5|nr:uncharacterized protein LOC108949545 [Ciona intestinalis]|eukprot:XP_018667778.1 uncharacterized protein LOC108949545 [Ciona intestinalis]
MSVKESYSRQYRKRKLAAEKHANDVTNKRHKMEETTTSYDVTLETCTRHISPLRPSMRRNSMTSSSIITSTPKRRSPKEKLWRPWVTSSNDDVRLRHNIRHHEYLQTIRQSGTQRLDLQRQSGITRLYHGVSPLRHGASPLRHNYVGNNEKVNPRWRAAVQVSTGFEHFKHPVKLMWPRSKAHDYFYAEGQKLLEGFPVQATIGLYDDTDSEQSDEHCLEQTNLFRSRAANQVLVQN